MGQVSLLFMVPFRSFSLPSPSSEFCSHHLYHLLLFLLQSSARICFHCYLKISSSRVILSLSGYNSAQFQYPGRGSSRHLVSKFLDCCSFNAYLSHSVPESYPRSSHHQCLQLPQSQLPTSQAGEHSLGFHLQQSSKPHETHSLSATHQQP